jgi:MYXO-CTERM domain-containing protein
VPETGAADPYAGIDLPVSQAHFDRSSASSHASPAPMAALVALGLLALASRRR